MGAKGMGAKGMGAKGMGQKGMTRRRGELRRVARRGVTMHSASLLLYAEPWVRRGAFPSADVSITSALEKHVTHS